MLILQSFLDIVDRRELINNSCLASVYNYCLVYSRKWEGDEAGNDVMGQGKIEEEFSKVNGQVCPLF